MMQFVVGSESAGEDHSDSNFFLREQAKRNAESSRRIAGWQLLTPMRRYHFRAQVAYCASDHLLELVLILLKDLAR
jgi:hypothetical protein